MSLRVTVQPSNHVLTVEKSETILQAALRAGLALDYGCTNGSCGQCKAQVTSGAVETVRFHDYPLSAAERQAGFCLLCCVAPAHDGVAIYAERARIGEIPRQSIAARVHRLERMGPDLGVLSLRTPRSKVLRFLPGQQLDLKRDGIGAWRLPIASCPCDGMNLRFHVRHQRGKPFSEWLFGELKRSDVVHLVGPWGRFSLDETSQRPIIFVAYDVDFGSASSLIEHAINIELGQSMALYWAVARPGEHYLDNQCRAWADALDGFSYAPLVTGEVKGAKGTGTPASGRDLEPPGLAVGARIVADHADLSPFDGYLMGPPVFRMAVKPVLLAHGLPGERLFEEDSCGA